MEGAEQHQVIHDGRHHGQRERAAPALKNAEATTAAASTLKSAEALWLPVLVWAVDLCIESTHKRSHRSISA
eukprot:SAG11_NODE_15266_length_583_cov_1.644628_1_plen_71_part_10